MTNLIPTDISLQYFLIGVIACFMKIFLEYRIKYNKNKNFKFISSGDVIFGIFSLFLAGVFTIVLQPISVFQAFIFGASWDFIFSTTVPIKKEKIEGKNEDE